MYGHSRTQRAGSQYLDSPARVVQEVDWWVLTAMDTLLTCGPKVGREGGLIIFLAVKVESEAPAARTVPGYALPPECTIVLKSPELVVWLAVVTCAALRNSSATRNACCGHIFEASLANHWLKAILHLCSVCTSKFVPLADR